MSEQQWESEIFTLSNLAKRWRMISNLRSSTMQMPVLTPPQQKIYDEYRSILIDMVNRGFDGYLNLEDQLPYILMPVQYLDLHTPKIKRYVQVDEISDPSSRWLASLTNHPIIEDMQGTYRFMQRDFYHFHDMNQLAIQYHHGEIERDKFMQFYRDIGYSLSGYWDVWGEELDMIARQQAMEEPIEEIEEEIYDTGDVVEQYLIAATELAEYNPDEDSLPDLEHVIKLLRLAAYLYKET